MADETAFCPWCGTPNRVAAKFCRSCGEAQPGAAAPPTGVPAPPTTAEATAPAPPMAPAPPPAAVHPATDPAPAATPPAPNEERSRRWVWVTALVVVVVLVIGGALLALTVGGTDDTAASDDTNTTEPSRPTTTESPTTTTTEPTTTTTALSAEAILIGPFVSAEGTKAYALAAELATSLARGDWARARQLEPAKAGFSDAEYVAAYGDLVDSTPVVVAATDGTPVRLRLGLVAVQTTSAGEQTTLYCVTWTADPQSSQVTQVAGESSQVRVAAGRIDPLAVVDELRSTC
jgi:hypothetical protein